MDIMEVWERECAKHADATWTTIPNVPRCTLYISSMVDDQAPAPSLTATETSLTATEPSATALTTMSECDSVDTACSASDPPFAIPTARPFHSVPHRGVAFVLLVDQDGRHVWVVTPSTTAGPQSPPKPKPKLRI
jgi:hypothetical protein